MKILVIKRDKIGDLILTTPIFELIKSHFPSAELHLLANTYNGWVVEGDPRIDQLWLYPRVREGGRGSLRALFAQIWQIVQLRRQCYDWIIVAGSYVSKRANQRAYHIAAESTRVVAYCQQGGSQKISDPVVPHDVGHETERMAALLEPLGIKGMAVPMPQIQPCAVWLDAARGFLAERELVPGGYVMLGVGARRRTRQPNSAQVLRWAQILQDRFGLQTVFAWTPGKRGDLLYPGDDDIAAGVLADCPSWLHPYRGDLGTVVGLTWLAKTSLYPDSGLMHVAAASPGGVVGLFSSSPEQWGPRGTRARVVVAQRRIDELPDEVFLSALSENLQ